jgi:hypothetical protein
VGLDFGHPEPNRDLTAETSGFSQVPGRTPLCTCPGLIPRGTLDARPIRRRGDSLPLVPRRRLPDLDLSRLITTACTLAVYASLRRVTPTPRKTRFRWVANPCRVGFGPTGSTTKGFRFCLMHFPSSLPRLDLARGTSSGLDSCSMSPSRASAGSLGRPRGAAHNSLAGCERSSCLPFFGRRPLGGPLQVRQPTVQRASGAGL